MGCNSSVNVAEKQQKKKKVSVSEICVFVPSLWIPTKTDVRGELKGLIPTDLVDRLACLRNNIVLMAEDSGGFTIPDMKKALEEYLPLLIGLFKTEYGLVESVQFKWRNLDDGHQVTCVANSLFELLSVIYLMAVLTLCEANSFMIPKDCYGSGVRIVSPDCRKDAILLLIQASGYLEFCIKEILPRIPPEIKKILPKDLQEGVLEAISIQALGQGTEIQLGLAVEIKNVTLSVKRRLACEQLTYYCQAYRCLAKCENNYSYGKKHLLFIKWKFLEAKAAAYYYHGLFLERGNLKSSHIRAMCCFLAAQELLLQSKKVSLSFCLAPPTTREPPICGAMEHLHKRIPEVALRKSQLCDYFLKQNKADRSLPALPIFYLSLRPDEFELPRIDEAWDIGSWEKQRDIV
ncbi:hypothetical protein ACFE04_010091 [Oxalis oulophora]